MPPKKATKKTETAAAEPKGVKTIGDPVRCAELLRSGFNGKEKPAGYDWSDRNGWVEDGPPKAPR
jgi:hypothetical protein